MILFEVYEYVLLVCYEIVKYTTKVQFVVLRYRIVSLGLSVLSDLLSYVCYLSFVYGLILRLGIGELAVHYGLNYANLFVDYLVICVFGTFLKL